MIFGKNRGWMGAGSIEDSGYEVHPESHK